MWMVKVVRRSGADFYQIWLRIPYQRWKQGCELCESILWVGLVVSLSVQNKTWGITNCMQSVLFVEICFCLCISIILVCECCGETKSFGAK